MSIRDLVLFTEWYPYRRGEEFIERELDCLSRRFARIVVVPASGYGTTPRRVPRNVDVVPLYAGLGHSVIRRLVAVLHWPELVLDLLLVDFRQDPKSTWVKLFGLPRSISRVAYVVLLRARLLKLIATRGLQSAVFYSYWINTSAALLAALARRGEIEGFVTRAHGNDLYHYRHPEGFIALRDLVFSQARRIVAISEHGRNYIRQYLESGEREKVVVGRLGTADHGMGPVPGSHDVIRVVSCAHVVPLKRVHLVIESLRHVTRRVAWTHVGGGPLLDELRARASVLPSNVTARLIGHLEHQDLIRFYQSEAFHLFLHLSEVEGLPVVLMEAISFGIPVLATGVGGVEEIVGPSRGILIPKDVVPEDVARIIDSLPESPMTSRVFREEVRAAWRDLFDAEKNYAEFAERDLCARDPI